MSLFFRTATPERRAVTSLEWSQGADLDSLPSTTAALSVIPVFAACRLISDSIATLPLQAFRKSGDTRLSIPLPSVFDKETRIEWVQQALMSLLLHGNAYGLVVARAGDGTPQTVVWLNPENVSVDESGPLPVFRWNGRVIDSNDLKHIPAYSVAGSVVGVSPIRACSLLVDTGSATQKMMRDWFKGRAVPGVTAQNTEKVLDPKQSEAIAERLRARLKNGQPFVHGKDWTIDVMKMPAEDAGFVASARLNATQVATIYGIPPEMIGGDTGTSMTYSTVELNMINFATLTLRPWLAKLEQEFSAWIHQPRFVKFNVDAMIRVDTKARYEVHKISREIGLNNIDELRSLEDEAPLPDGQGQDYTPLSAKQPAPTEKRSVTEADVRSLLLESQRSEPLTLNVNIDPPNVPVSVNIEPSPITVQPSRMTMMPAMRETTPAPVVNVNVEPTPLEVNVESPTVNVDVQPSDVTILPTEPKTRRVERDNNGDIIAVHEES